MYIETILHDKKLIIITYQSGVLNLETLVTNGLKIRQKAFALGYRLLFDLRKVKNGLTVSDGLGWIEKHLDPINTKLKRIPTMYIVEEKDFAFYKLLQHIWDNKGIEILIFQNLEKGIKWFEKHDITIRSSD